MNTAGVYGRLAAACLLVALAACSQPPEGAGPLLLEDPNANSLTREVEDAISDLEKVRNDLAAHPKEANSAVDGALARLNLIAGYYLPVMQARERAYNAFHLYEHREIDRTLRELDLIEEILLGVATNQGERVGRELDPPLEAVEAARVAVKSESAEAPRALVALTQKLHALIVKGRLVTG